MSAEICHHLEVVDSKVAGRFTRLPAYETRTITKLNVYNPEARGMPPGTRIVSESEYTRVKIPLGNVKIILFGENEINSEVIPAEGKREVELKIGLGQRVEFYPDGNRLVFEKYRRVDVITHLRQTE